MPAQSRGRRVFMYGVGAIPIVLVLLAVRSGFAQQQEVNGSKGQLPQASQEKLAAPDPSLSASDLQLQLKQVQEATELPEEAKSQAVGLYTQAIQQLTIAEQLAAKAAEFEAERQNAPETLSAIQTELAAPLGEAVPDSSMDAPRTEIEARLRQVQSDLDAEKKSLSDWERERDRRTARRKEIPDLLTAAKARLQTMTETPTVPEVEQVAALRLAQQALNQSKRLAVVREIDAYNSELLSYDARRGLLQARLDRAARRVAYLEKLVAAWQRLVQEKARSESELALREARDQLKRAHPAIRPLAEEREQLALRAKAVQASIKDIELRLTETEATLAQVNQDFDKIIRRVNATGLTNAIGQLLRKHRASLPNLRPSDRTLRQRKDKISDAQLAMMELEDRRSELVSIEATVAEIMKSVDAGTSEEQRAMLRQAAEEAVVALRGDVDSLLKEYDRAFDRLVDLDSKERELLETIERFDEYVDEKVLWIKSGSAPRLEDVGEGREALLWFLSPRGWSGVFKVVLGTLRSSPGIPIVGLMVVALVWAVSRRLVRFIKQAGEAIAKPSKDSMTLTVGALLATALLALRWPLTLWFASWVISSPWDAGDFSRAVGEGLNATAVIVLTLRFARQLVRQNGLAEKHFRWNVRSLAIVKRHLAWLTIVVVPCSFVFSTLEAQSVEAGKDTLGRAAFVVAFLAITLFVQRVLRPSGPVLLPILRGDREGWFYRLRHFWYVLILAAPLALVGAAIVGYYYTAFYLGTRILESTWLLVGLLVVNGLVERWLLLQIRRRAIAEARERAAQRSQQKEEEATEAETAAVGVAEEKLDVASINKQTLQLVRVTLAVLAFAILWGIWAETLPALGVFREVELWRIKEQVVKTVGTENGGNQLQEYVDVVPISLADLGLAGLVALITIVAVKNIPGLLEVAVLQHLPIDAGGRFAATAITRYVLTVVGLIVAFGQIGVGWAKVQWLVAAMTVGLGFGLQEIFANLVSGLMLLFERPIRIGDTVTVADTSGTVARIRTRTTTIVGWDRKELIIPNKEFITGKVVNWSLSDSTLRIVIPVGIAYGADTKLARKVLKEIIEGHKHVLEDPKPRVFFVGFGDSALNFEIRVFIGHIDHYLHTIDDIHEAVDQGFRKAGIEIAFPQRDIHVRSIKGVLPIAKEWNACEPPSSAGEEFASE